MKGALVLVLFSLVSLGYCSSYAVLDVGTQLEGVLDGTEDTQFFVTRLPDNVDLSSERLWLVYRIGGSTANICAYASQDELPGPSNFHFANCTGQGAAGHHGGFITSLLIPAHAYPPSAWAISVQGEGEFLIRVDALRQEGPEPGMPPEIPPPADRTCPHVHGHPDDVLVVAGPYQQDNFCYYLTVAGQTCDAACSAIGGNNLIDLALHTFPETCPSSCTDEPVNAFQQASANVYHWHTESHPTAFSTIGYGYTDSYYVCHCRNGSIGRGGGALVGDYNNHHDRSIICPCFFLG